MKKPYILSGVVTIFYLLAVTTAANGQGRETFTGTVFKYGSGVYTGMRTANFTLTINGVTPDDKAQGFLALLQESGQDALLNAIRREDVGSFSLDQNIARTINVVREVNSGGKRKIYAVFERWEQFAEVRGGYRSLDYPFGYIELTIDSATGKGSGQYFAAAKIRWKNDKKIGSHVEIEDYATFPAKLVNVKSDRSRR